MYDKDKEIYIASELQQLLCSQRHDLHTIINKYKNDENISDELKFLFFTVLKNQSTQKDNIDIFKGCLLNQPR